MYVEQLRAALQACSTKLEELVEGKISIQDEDERTKLIIKLLQETKISVKAASYPSRWYGQLGAKWLEENGAAIGRGINIERILIIPNETGSELPNLVKKQLKLGIKLHIALESSIPDELRRNFIVFDDTIATLASFNSRGVNVGGIISTSEWDIQQAQRNWERLRLYSREIRSAEEIPTIMRYLTNPVPLDSNENNVELSQEAPYDEQESHEITVKS
ncbi:MAG: hypothetical protein HYR94_10275 [Chloroflexi bacterium]|nr:hypothetical protein [Chloroflexota bacterium]